MGMLDKLKRLGEAINLDGWINEKTGLGTTSRDKAIAMRYGGHALLNDWELESMYEGDDMVSTIVDAPIEDGLRKGFNVTIKADEDEDGDDPGKRKEMEKAIAMRMDELDALTKISDAASWGRLFGGAVMWPQTDDPGALNEELNMDQIRQVHSILVMDKRDVYPITWDSDPLSKTFAQPLVYGVGVTNAHGGTMPLQTVHASRLIVFTGARTTLRRRLYNNGWPTSVMQKPYNVLQKFHTAFDSTAHLMTDSSQGVYKIKDLIAMLGSKEKDELENRMRIIEMGKSVVRGILLDAEDEDYERKQTAMSGYGDVLDRFSQRLAAAAKMPLTRMMGISPAGMNATGENDRGNWDETVQAFQRYQLKPRIEKLVEFIMAAKDGPTNGRILENWSVTFDPLRQMTQKEQAELHKSQAEADRVYVDMGLPAEQVLLSRFGGEEYSIETEVDVEMLNEIMQADKEHAISIAQDPEKTRMLAEGGNPSDPAPGGNEQDPSKPPTDPNQPPPPPQPEPDDEDDDSGDE